MRDAFLHHFGQGIGFGAELLDLSWSYYHACGNGLSFAMHTSSPPKGVAVGAGWSDYFLPFCPDIPLGPLSSLNRHLQSRKARLLHTPYRLVLDAHLQRRFYYLFDRNILANRWEHKTSVAHALDRGQLLRSIYLLNQQTIDFLESHKTGTSLGDITIAVHLRRGDKITEAPYADLNRYAQSIRAIPDWRNQSIYIMSDSLTARKELLDALGIGEQNIMKTPVTNIRGYDQKKFNNKKPAERQLETLNLIAEIEIARVAKHFIGTSTSNLYYLISLLREEGMPDMVSVEAPSEGLLD